MQQVLEVGQLEASVSRAAAAPASPALLAQLNGLSRDLLESQAHVEAQRAREASRGAEVEAARRAVAAAEERAGEGDRERARLERHAAQLQETIAGLQLRLGAGEFNRAATKVVHLKQNPAAASRACVLGRAARARSSRE